MRMAPGQVGAGNVGAFLALTNTSHQTCTVQGYPGLGLQNAHHHNQSIHVAWGSTYFAKDPGSHPVTLRPGQSAYAAMAWNQPDGTRSVTPAYLLVTPPDQTSHLTTPFAPGPINAGTLQVTSLAATPPGASPPRSRCPSRNSPTTAPSPGRCGPATPPKWWSPAATAAHRAGSPHRAPSSAVRPRCCPPRTGPPSRGSRPSPPRAGRSLSTPSARTPPPAPPPPSPSVRDRLRSHGQTSCPAPPGARHTAQGVPHAHP
ncbi:DUF4232 domain-containing protein [Streptacidiphilus sp. 4-A2]|nr:DUF4232 domain-containing protein [Streptacidiphilus sp. 4-A2]